VQLGAYRCLVIDEMREVVSTDEEPWAEIAARLGGGWVPSLDGEMAALRAEREPRPAVTVPDISADPAIDRTLRLADGRRITVAEWGDPDGRPVFLLHGMPGSRRMCPDATVTAAARVRLIAPDRPGYGGSDPAPGRTVADGAADVAELATQLGVDRFSVVGWSSGGPYALAVAALHPDRVEAVALVAAVAPADEFPALNDGLPERIRERVARIRAGDPTIPAELESRIQPYVDRPDSILEGDGTGDAIRNDPAVQAALATMFEEALRQGPAGWRDDWIAEDRPWGFRLRDVQRPVDIWWGDADTLTPPAHTNALEEGLAKAARLHVIPGAGHLVVATHWREILDALFEAADRPVG
jgi:pimeloyl-ACP methyl ester carboxylesterase